MSYQTVQESGTLQRDVACSDEQRLSGRPLEAEQVIRRDPELPSSRDVRVLRSASGGQDKSRGRNGLFGSAFVVRLDRVRVFEPCVLVEVSHLQTARPD